MHSKTLQRIRVAIVISFIATILASSLELIPTKEAHIAFADTQLAVPYLNQYPGNPTDDFDCGPTSVAMILEYFYGMPNEASRGLVAHVRQSINDHRASNDKTDTDTSLSDLEAALVAYGLTSTEIPSTLSPQPDAQMQAIEQAVTSGLPVIAFIHGADLGRGQAYGDHFVVVTGFSSDGQTVYLNDPDTQAPRWAGWIQGGQISLSLSTFAQAAYHAPAGPYGIIAESPPTGTSSTTTAIQRDYPNGVVVRNAPSTPSPTPTPSEQPQPPATIHQVDDMQCSNRGDFFKVYGEFVGSQTQCWANAGTANVELSYVYQITTGNNAGYFVGGNSGQGSTITTFNKWQTITINCDWAGIGSPSCQPITQIVIAA